MALPQKNIRLFDRFNIDWQVKDRPGLMQGAADPLNAAAARLRGHIAAFTRGVWPSWAGCCGFKGWLFEFHLLISTWAESVPGCGVAALSRRLASSASLRTSEKKETSTGL